MFSQLTLKTQKEIVNFSYQDKFANFLLSMFKYFGEQFESGEWEKDIFETILLKNGMIAIWKINDKINEISREEEEELNCNLKLR